MKVTVIIPNYNGKHFLDACMRSLEKQTYQIGKDMRVIVIDNGSTDGSCEFLKEQYKEMEIVTQKKNVGFCGAVNIGIRMSKTPYVILLNNDTEVEQEFVEKLVQAMEDHPKAFSITSKMINYSDRTRIDDTGDMYCVVGWQFQRGVGQKRENYTEESKIFSACAGAAIYRKSVFEKLGYFDEGHFAYLEDMDIGWRARIQGYENWFCPEAIVYHVGSGTSGSKYNEFKVRFSSRNSVYINYKNMPTFFLILNFIPLCVGYFVKWLFFCRIGLGKTYANGILEGIRTRKTCEKVKFMWKNLPCYLSIEWELIRNTFLYIKEYIKRHEAV